MSYALLKSLLFLKLFIILMIKYPEISRSKTSIPRIDTHIHLDGVTKFPILLEESGKFNVTNFIGLTPWYEANNDMRKFEQQYPDKLRFSFYTPRIIIKEPLKGVKKLQGYIKTFKPRNKLKLIKFWCGSSFFSDNSRIDTPFHQELYNLIRDEDLFLMIHITDPDSWYTKLETKLNQLKQFENIVANNPELKIVGVHMGGSIERIEVLDEWLTKYNNLYLDTSATKWITRELSHNRDQARVFFKKHANKILYASDLVNDHDSAEYYFSRYWTHRVLFETDIITELPFKDPDSVTQPALIKGLDLGTEILNKIYYQNAKELFFS